MDTTNDQLASEMERMRKANVPQLLADEMPLACLIITHYEKFIALLPT